MKYIKIFGFKDFVLYCFFYIINLIISIPLKCINIMAKAFEKLSSALYSIPSGTAFIPESLNSRIHDKAKRHRKYIYKPIELEKENYYRLQQRYF